MVRSQIGAAVDRDFAAPLEYYTAGGAVAVGQTLVGD
jgi:hypothetical protein